MWGRRWASSSFDRLDRWPCSDATGEWTRWMQTWKSRLIWECPPRRPVWRHITLYDVHSPDGKLWMDIGRQGIHRRRWRLVLRKKHSLSTLLLDREDNSESPGTVTYSMQNDTHHGQLWVSVDIEVSHTEEERRSCGWTVQSICKCCLRIILVARLHWSICKIKMRCRSTTTVSSPERWDHHWLRQYIPSPLWSLPQMCFDLRGCLHRGTTSYHTVFRSWRTCLRKSDRFVGVHSRGERVG